jgi:hypothetical protein
VAFFEAHPLPRNTRKIDQIVEGTRANAAYVSRIRGGRAKALAWLVEAQ